MKTKILYLTLLLLLFIKVSQAQDKGLTFLLGPSVNLYYGDSKEKFSYSRDMLSLQANAQLGIISTRGGTNRGNFLGVFATAGSSNHSVLALMKTNGADMSGVLDVNKSFNEFYSLEGGMIIARFLRLSGGFGRQTYVHDNDLKGTLNYFTGTVGFVFNLDAVNWVIDANLLTGKDLNQNAIRFSTGFMVKF